MTIIDPKRSFPYNKDLKQQARDLRNNMTKHEKMLWYEFLRKRKPRFLRQKIINNYIVDFYCAKTKLVVEIDGQTHLDREQEIYDKERTKILEKDGIKVLRFYNNEIENNFEEVCKKINNLF